eukprot:1161078-Pelagomonas_calceolata.AAC.22
MRMFPRFLVPLLLVLPPAVVPPAHAPLSRGTLDSQGCFWRNTRCGGPGGSLRHRTCGAVRQTHQNIITSPLPLTLAGTTTTAFMYFIDDTSAVTLLTSLAEESAGMGEQ